MEDKAIWYNIKFKPNKFYNGAEGEPTHKAAVPVNGRWITVGVVREEAGGVLRVSLSREGVREYIKNQEIFKRMKTEGQQSHQQPAATKASATPISYSKNEEDAINIDDLPF